MIDTKNQIKATFTVLDTTDKKKFQTAMRAVYRGEADEEQVAYVLDNVKDITIGHDPEVMREAGRKRWSK